MLHFADSDLPCLPSTCSSAQYQVWYKRSTTATAQPNSHVPHILPHQIHFTIATPKLSRNRRTLGNHHRSSTIEISILLLETHTVLARVKTAKKDRAHTPRRPAQIHEVDLLVVKIDGVQARAKRSNGVDYNRSNTLRWRDNLSWSNTLS